MKLYAVVRRGKRAGQEIEVGQYCNDWFAEANTNAIFKPNALAFSAHGTEQIEKHKGNGILFDLFAFHRINGNLYNKGKDYRDEYDISFKRLKIGVCRKCGCTDVHACEGGCSWVNPYHTLCSRHGKK